MSSELLNRTNGQNPDMSVVRLCFPIRTNGHNPLGVSGCPNAPDELRASSSRAAQDNLSRDHTALSGQRTHSIAHEASP